MSSGNDERGWIESATHHWLNLPHHEPVVPVNAEEVPDFRQPEHEKLRGSDIVRPNLMP